MAEMPKSYDPKQYEDNWYRFWESHVFSARDKLDGKPFCIIMPPNVTGALAMP